MCGNIWPSADDSENCTGTAERSPFVPASAGAVGGRGDRGDPSSCRGTGSAPHSGMAVTASAVLPDIKRNLNPGLGSPPRSVKWSVRDFSAPVQALPAPVSVFHTFSAVSLRGQRDVLVPFQPAGFPHGLGKTVGSSLTLASWSQSGWRSWGKTAVRWGGGRDMRP